MNKRWCWYCRHRHCRFRIDGEGYVHCGHPNLDVSCGGASHHDGVLSYSGWATVRHCWESCGEFESEQEAGR